MFENFDETTKKVEARLNDTSLMDNFDEEAFWNKIMTKVDELVTIDVRDARNLVFFYFLYFIFHFGV